MRSPVQPTRSEDVNFEGFPERACGEHRTVGPHRAWCYDCREWCSPSLPCLGCDRTEEKLEAVRALVARYRKVSDSATQVMYVRDVERALGLDLPPVKDSDGRTDW